MASENVGRVTQIIGPVVDVEFEGGVPPIYQALHIKEAATDGGAAVDVIAEVQQHLGNNWVRCVAMDSTDGLIRGVEVLSARVAHAVLAAEHPKGELGFYLVSDGGTNPYRYHVRSSCFANLGALEAMSVGHLLADAIVILGSIDTTMGEVDR